MAGNPMANPVWGAVAENLGFSGGAVSIAPGVTLRSIPGVAVPFLVFGTALLLSRDDVEGLRTWRALALLGITVPLFGLLRYLAFPNMRLFDQTFLDPTVVTSVFVNRNNAATFFGLASLAALGWLFWQTSQPGRTRSPRTPSQPGLAFLERHTGILLTTLVLLATLVALFLTRSRAGIVLSFASLLAALLGIIHTSRWRDVGPVGRWTATGTVILAAFAVFSLFGGQTLLRVETSGYDEGRACLYRETLAAIGDNPLWGTGFGTFEDVFAMYRLPECGIYGIIEQAHNSYLEAYLGLGLPFVPLFLVCLVLLLRCYLTGLRERRRLRPIPIVCLAALGLVLAHSAVDFPIQIHGIAVYFAALLGSGAGISLARSER
ncbi:O-antigen ligase family protein [Jiella pacifica]|uniref:O-antigen ligase-related domain-containing protein n=1 Tax=Jiella pacifica TaxID=2696469 RepID=A0A6N9T3G9_9HYPH|nr:O-antigen ligase family protein [Jiella pacifica]NDW04379.1 hypothetical protein [Jiella pacifica]